ncbi:ComF family protein [Paenibacillus sp. 481]|uniref:ComF family protein n=1 Tax=Paenibacillus sp. 481 TaxID=2835869 RepID=UPI001E2D9BA6|nr:hypothetical protein [Paenibacillus sp. 481]UHA75703.1 ComF family protein [Paenibacillus sp. 481]
MRFFTKHTWSEWMRRGYNTLFQPELTTCQSCRKNAAMPLQPNHLRQQAASFDARGQVLKLWLCAACIGTIPWIQAVGCKSCGRAIRCTDCERHPLHAWGLAGNRSVVRYDNHMKHWLSQYKFYGLNVYGEIIGRMMSVSYPMLFTGFMNSLGRCTSNGGRSGWSSNCMLPDIITFVPTSEQRLYERGFNQAEQLAQIMGRTWNRPVVPLLMREQETAKQSMQTRSGRERNIANVFQLRSDVGYVGHLETNKCGHVIKGMGQHGKQNDQPDGIVMLLVDDVYTTGSTLRACAREIASLQSVIRRPLYVLSYTWARA